MMFRVLLAASNNDAHPAKAISWLIVVASLLTSQASDKQQHRTDDDEKDANKTRASNNEI
jgi:hypothetical protein